MHDKCYFIDSKCAEQRNKERCVANQLLCGTHVMQRVYKRLHVQQTITVMCVTNVETAGGVR